MTVKQILLDHGWSEEGATFLDERRDDPRVVKMMRRFGLKGPLPRTTQRKKQVITRRIRKAVFERDAYRCRHCGTWYDLCVDHIIPESAGGTLDLDNLQTLCRRCNSIKGTKHER